ncbi:hypothetical protein QAD02_003682 [Eretmocerus hayati]|uniref:Uncharacterized protein n=1 Tax=Eretmocerus hayati TaxID=131215 RepID=A0ACC2NNL9_9HYME|nr:hypothetical protein QAD02_003682 [Eretmocerus hayati]
METSDMEVESSQNQTDHENGETGSSQTELNDSSDKAVDPTRFNFEIDVDGIINSFYDQIQKNKPLFKLLYETFTEKMCLYAYATGQLIKTYRVFVAKIHTECTLAKTDFLSLILDGLSDDTVEPFPNEKKFNLYELSTTAVDDDTDQVDRVSAKGPYQSAWDTVRGSAVPAGLKHYLPNIYHSVKPKDPRKTLVWQLSHSHRQSGACVVKVGLEVIQYFLVLTTILAPVLVDYGFRILLDASESTSDVVFSQQLIKTWPEGSKKLVTSALKRIEEEANREAIKQAIRESKNKNRKKLTTFLQKQLNRKRWVTMSLDCIFTQLIVLLSDVHVQILFFSFLNNEDALGFLIINFFLKLTNYKHKDPDNRWRPQLKDIALSFIVHLKLHEKLQELISAVKDEQILRYQGQHPYIVYCGEFHNLKCCHVIVSDTVYDSVFAVEAVDFLFKLFFVIKLAWPPACKQIWSFLMKWSYKIEKNKRKIVSGPFVKNLMESKRLQVYSELGIYKEPKMCTVAQVSVTKLANSNSDLKTKDVSIVSSPIDEGLKRLFEIEGLLDATVAYDNRLRAKKYPMENFCQGELWDRLAENFSGDQIVLRLFGYCDGLQTGSPLGTHASEGSLETFHVQPAVLPPNIISKNSSIIVTDIFLTKTRKEYSNKAVFSHLIEGAKRIRREGVELNIKEEDVSLLRTVEKYEEDISLEKSVQETGLQGECIFNELDDYHVIPYASVDVMHDVFEGICHYVMAQVVLYLVSLKGCFSIDYLNFRMENFNFGFKSSNVPPMISYEYVKTNNRFKMSASEMLFFVRYFAIFVGKVAPVDSLFWKLYLLLREIVQLLTSPIVTHLMLASLEALISELLALYVSLVGPLKPKFHLLLHYIRIIRQTGPIIKISSMRFEAFHQIIKKCIEYSNCHINTLKTIGIRLQLNFTNLSTMKYEQVFKSYGKEEIGTLANSLFSGYVKKREVQSVTLNGITYAENSIIVFDFSPHGIIFGVVKNVFDVDNEIIFQYQPLKPCGFHEPYAAHMVDTEGDDYC